MRSVTYKKKTFTYVCNYQTKNTCMPHFNSITGIPLYQTKVSLHTLPAQIISYISNLIQLPTKYAIRVWVSNVITHIYHHLIIRAFTRYVNHEFYLPLRTPIYFIMEGAIPNTVTFHRETQQSTLTTYYECYLSYHRHFISFSEMIIIFFGLKYSISY